jgi:4-hydroxybenzoate polyprenyltransferase
MTGLGLALGTFSISLRAAMNRSGKLHALLATSRIANVPSVVSNVWLGVAVAALSGAWSSFENPWSAAVRLALAGILLYVAGNFLNDWMDREWDAKHRPERALPRALFPPSLYLTVASVCSALGLVLAATTRLAAGTVALGIIVAVIIYTIWHKRSPLSVIAMGICRALLPVMGAAGFSAASGTAAQLPTGQLFEIESRSPGLILAVVCALGLFAHIAGLSLSARSESQATPPAAISRTGKILFGVALAAASYVGWLESGAWTLALVGGLPYAIWISLSLSLWRKPVPVHVSRLLAGIPLVDWAVLLPITMALGIASDAFALACFGIPPLAFILALLLQRLAPAT